VNKRLEYFVHVQAVRGAPRLDGARVKKQV